MCNLLGVLFPYLVLIYLIDSIRIIRKNHLLFISHLGKHFQVRVSGFYLSELFPLEQVIYSHCQPVCYTAEGVYLFDDCNKNSHSNPERPVFVKYEEIDSVKAEHCTVKINGRSFFRAPTKRSAAHMAETVTGLKSLPPAERQKGIASNMERAFDLTNLRKSKEEYKRLLTPVKLLSAVLFAYVFALLPLSLFTRLQNHVSLYALVINIVIVYAMTVLVSYSAYRKIHGSGSRGGYLFLLLLALSPMTALHAPSKLTEDLYHRFDYLAVSAVLLGIDEFKAVAEAELRRINYVLKQKGDEALREYWALRERAIHGLLDGLSITPQSVMQKPAKRDGLALTYCPVCLTEFGKGPANCSDCGVELEKY